MKPELAKNGAGDRTRTGDSLVGNEGLYQLSYSRPLYFNFQSERRI